MNKIKLVLYSTVVSTGCVSQDYMCIAKYIDRDKFHMILATTGRGGYLEQITPFFDEVLALNGDEDQEFVRWANHNEVDVVVHYRAGAAEFPLSNHGLKAKTICRNVFAQVDDLVDHHMCISEGVYNSLYGKIPDHKLSVVPLLNEVPLSTDNLRTTLGIPEDAVVLGRASNPWAGDTNVYRMYRMIRQLVDKKLDLYLISAGHPWGADLDNLDNYIEIDPITTFEGMSEFYNTMDILLHARHESFGCAVLQAMMHNVPVVSCSDPKTPVNFTNAHALFFCDQQNISLDLETCARNARNLCHDASHREGLAFMQKRFLGNQYHPANLATRFADVIYGVLYG